MRVFVLVSLLSLAVSACSSDELYLPEGDPAAGKVVFTELQCYSCHQVEGDEYPPPSTITPTYVTLGGRELSRQYLVESLIAPSHEFARPEPPEGQTASLNNVRTGNRSRMTNYSKLMTVQQLVDLVAYLRELQEASNPAGG